MEKIKLNAFKAHNFVKEGLILIGFPENIEVCSFIGDEDRPIYYATYEKFNNGKVEKHIKPLRIKDFVDLMEFAMSIGGYDIKGIEIKVRDESIDYYVMTNIVSYDNPTKRKRR